jgi:hypothetical protein
VLPSSACVAACRFAASTICWRSARWKRAEKYPGGRLEVVFGQQRAITRGVETWRWIGVDAAERGGPDLRERGAQEGFGQVEAVGAEDQGNGFRPTRKFAIE